MNTTKKIGIGKYTRTPESIERWRKKMVGREFSSEHRLKISLGIKSAYQKNPLKWKTKKGKRTEEYRRQKSESQRGEKGNNWQGGITPYHSRARNNFEYRLFKEKVLERDNYTCVMCGASPKDNPHVQLDVDHIKPFKFNSDLRLDTNNGRTVCLLCHKKTQTYGNRKVTQEEDVIV